MHVSIAKTDFSPEESGASVRGVNKIKVETSLAPESEAKSYSDLDITKRMSFTHLPNGTSNGQASQSLSMRW